MLWGSDSDSMPTPYASRSGFAAWSNLVGPRELKLASVSSPRDGVPWWLAAPTVSTQGAFPGHVTPPYCSLPLSCVPRFPAAATTTMPAFTARRAAWASGSVLYDSKTPDATETFMTRML